MKVCDLDDVAVALARQYRKPLLYLHVDDDMDTTDAGVVRAAPYLNVIEHGQALLDGSFFIVCNDRAEQRQLYGLTVGDDGPTKTNPYAGKHRVYACMYSNKGVDEGENT